MFNLTLSAQRQIGIHITKSINDKYEQNLLNTNDIAKNTGLFGNRQIKTQDFGIFINTAIPIKANKYINVKIGFDRVEGHEIYSFERGDVNESFEKTSFDYHNYAVKTSVGYMNTVKFKTLSFFWMPELLANTLSLPLAIAKIMENQDYIVYTQKITFWLGTWLVIF